MSRRDRHGVVTSIGIAFGVAAAVVAPGAGAHLAAGGSLAPLAAGLALSAIAAVAAVLGRLRLRWTFPRLAVAALLAQPVLHVVFAAGHGADPVAGGHQGHHAHGAGQHVEQALGAAAGSPPHGTWMALAHVAVAFGVAAGLRWGLRWLRSMPALARALVLPRRWVVAPCADRGWSVVARTDARPRHLVMLAAHGSRGPPR